MVEKAKPAMYFRVVKDGEIVDIVKAKHSNVAARSVLTSLGYIVQSADTDDVLEFFKAGREIKEIKSTRTKRATEPYTVSGIKEDS